MNVKCPKCGADAEYLPGDAEMCPECGAELKPADPAKKAEVLQGMDVSRLFAEMADASRTTLTDGGSLAERSRQMAEAIDSDSEPRSRRSNPYLEVEYNRNLFFVSGSSSVIRLRITPKSNQLRSIMLFMETQGAKSERILRDIPINELLQSGVTVEARLAYRPEQVSGQQLFNFYIGCNLETETVYYQFNIEHKIYDPEQLAAAKEQPSITITQEINVSEAGEVNLRDDIGRALRDMSGKSLSLHELIDRMNDLPPKFERQELHPTLWRPETMIVRGTPYPGDRLLLEWNGKRLLLFGGGHIRFGRSAEQCDIVVRSGNANLGPRDYPNNTVSRIHAEILYGGDAVQLFDKSSFGTFINGRRPDSAGMPIPESATVEFGDIHWQMNLQFCRMRQPHTICQTCIANRVKAMTFTRKDQAPEYYFLVWQCCELGLVIPELSDWTVFFRDNAFFIRTPEQNFHYLRPGSVFSAGQQTIKVNYFQQN